ncbi:MAG: hypothetical protein N2746_03955 [Deltaproteobacteria bacterium]|nr:hypothetical protein [Deltaproteobacteria bacterium]
MNYLGWMTIIFLFYTSSNKDIKGMLIDKAIVEVEKEVITLMELETHSKIQIVISEGPSSLYKITDSGFINSMINLIINRELVSQELKKEKKYKPHLFTKEAERLYIKIKDKFGNSMEFDKFLKEINLNELEFKKILAVYIMIDEYISKVVEDKAKVDEEELNRYLQINQITGPLDTETYNKYLNALKSEKRKLNAAQYLEELKNRYRIRYLYIPK